MGLEAQRESAEPPPPSVTGSFLPAGAPKGDVSLNTADFLPRRIDRDSANIPDGSTTPYTPKRGSEEHYKRSNQPKIKIEELPKLAAEGGKTFRITGGRLNYDLTLSAGWENLSDPQHIASGSFGDVIKCQRGYQIVAVKICKPNPDPDSEEQARKRAERERDVLQIANNSPLRDCIVSILGDFNGTITCSDSKGNKVARELPVIITEYIPGDTLDVEIANSSRASDPDKRHDAQHHCLKWMLPVCDALTALHGEGIVHRDLKPSNIKLLNDPTSERCSVRVLDLGLAGGAKLKELDLNFEASPASGKLAESLADAHPYATMTVAGSILGTPTHMSPEQARGESHEADARSDIFACGVIIYQIATGQLPFKGKSSSEILLSVKNDEVKWSNVEARTMPIGLKAIIDKCLRKGVEERYQSAEALKHDLELYLADRPVPAVKEYYKRGNSEDSPGAWLAYLEYWVLTNTHRHRHNVGLAGAAVVLASALTGGSLQLVQAEKNYRTDQVTAESFDRQLIEYCGLLPAELPLAERRLEALSLAVSKEINKVRSYSNRKKLEVLDSLVNTKKETEYAIKLAKTYQDFLKVAKEADDRSFELNSVRMFQENNELRDNRFAALELLGVVRANSRGMPEVNPGWEQRTFRDFPESWQQSCLELIYRNLRGISMTLLPDPKTGDQAAVARSGLEIIKYLGNSSLFVDLEKDSYLLAEFSEMLLPFLPADEQQPYLGLTVSRAPTTPMDYFFMVWRGVPEGEELSVIEKLAEGMLKYPRDPYFPALIYRVSRKVPNWPDELDSYLVGRAAGLSKATGGDYSIINVSTGVGANISFRLVADKSLKGNPEEVAAFRRVGHLWLKMFEADELEAWEKRVYPWENSGINLLSFYIKNKEFSKAKDLCEQGFKECEEDYKKTRRDHSKSGMIRFKISRLSVAILEGDWAEAERLGPELLALSEDIPKLNPAVRQVTVRHFSGNCEALQATLRREKNQSESHFRASELIDKLLTAASLPAAEGLVSSGK